MLMPKPNFLILMADQLTPGALPAYGNAVARTPNLDSLAAGGITFRSAYCNSPLCAPSRFSFMTGRLPSAIGAYDNAAELSAELPTFAHYLRLAGYRTVLSGKMHFCGPDQLHGFEERLTTDIYPADFGWTPDWTRFDERPGWYHSMDSVIRAGPCTRTNQVDFDDEVVFAARRKLFDIARGKDRRPFCLVVSMTHPHDPYVIPEPYWNRYRDSEIDLPRVTQRDLDEDPHSRRLGLASEGEALAYAAPIDGRSLLPALEGGAGPGQVVGEYLAEGAVAPIVMIRRGRYKFVHSAADPDQLYDLSADPDERVNLSSRADCAAAVAEFRAEVARRWSLDEIHQAVLASQRRRHLVYAALREGRYRPWDHQPLRDASRLYIRNDQELNDLEAMARFPPLA